MIDLLIPKGTAENMKSKIFISYRRDDSADIVARIYERLVAKFGKEDVFRDLDSIPLGIDFKKYIENVVHQCAVELVIISKRWLDIIGKHGQCRLDNPSDSVRIEIESALNRDIPVIPLLVSGATMPLEAQLPFSLAKLARRNGLPIRHDPDFHGDMDKLIESLDQWLTGGIDTELTSIDIERAETFRRTKATAVLVIMFIDMANSTALRDEMGEVEFEELRQTKKDKLTSIIEQGNHGHLVKDLGDGYLAIFAIPEKAVEVALEIQEELTDPIYQLRIGLDIGQVTQESEGKIVRDVFGKQVNRAARIEAICEGGHILTSYTVWDCAEGWFKRLGYIVWKRHGNYQLKGFGEPIEVFEPYNQNRTRPSDRLRQEAVKPKLDPTKNTLRVFEKISRGEQLRLETNSRLVTIGRSPDSDIVSPEMTVSWEHGVILFTRGNYIYRHLSKVNPTRVVRDNEEILLRQGVDTECSIRNNTRIIIGDQALIIYTNIPTANQPPAPTQKQTEDV